MTDEVKRQRLGFRATKKFDGEAYNYAQGFTAKKEAKDFAEKWRRKGYKARIVPSRLEWGQRVYLVYIKEARG